MKCKYEHPANETIECENDPIWVITVAFGDTYAHSAYCNLHIEEAKEYAYHGAPVYTMEEWEQIWPGSELME